MKRIKAGTRGTSRLPKTPKTRTAGQKDHPPPLSGVDREHVEYLLDEALQDTFPASDPIAIGGDRLNGSDGNTTSTKRR